MPAPRSGIAAAALWSLLLLAGCKHPFANRPAGAVDPAGGYRFNVADNAAGNDDAVFVILAFSGGGTRAAAFAFGALEGLNQITYVRNGQTHHLIDDVHIISSVSGGSFTAAYYGLKSRSEFFGTFPSRFLYRDVEGALALELLKPANWVKLASPYYGRIDMAAEYYDAEIFEHKTFNDLKVGPGRPFILINSTDMAYVNRFEFSQDQFDLLGSDLGSFPIGRAVAASSAFPILLTPLTIHDYPKAAGAPVPEWITEGLNDQDLAPRSYANSIQNDAYFKNSNIQYIHLLDGGLADNIGLRGPSAAIAGAAMPWTLQKPFHDKIRYLVVIAVDARANNGRNWSDQEGPPGLGAVFGTVTGGPLDNYSSDTVQEIRDYLTETNQIAETLKKLHQYTDGPLLAAPSHIYTMDLTFDDVKSASLRDDLNRIDTNYSLTRTEVDELRRAGSELMIEAVGRNKVCADLHADSP